MKTLKEFIKEEIGLGSVYVTPTNTGGMGNPSAPTDTQPGSGDIFDIKTKKKKTRLYNLIKSKLKLKEVS